jgi:hypothetical protein
LAPPAAPIGAQIGELDAQSVDLSKRNQLQSTQVTLEGGKAQENIVEILRRELESKNREIFALRTENRTLKRRIDAIDSVFSMVRIIIGEHLLSVNDYISYTALFLADKRLSTEFGSFLPADMRRR